MHLTLRPTANALILAGLAALLVSGCAGRQRTNLPDVTLPHLDGGHWNLQSAAGNIVVLQFFASFDNSSISLATSLERLHMAYRRRGVTIIGVAMDPPTTPNRRDIVEAFCALNNLTFEIVLSSPELAAGETAVGRIPTIPATVIFDRDGDPVASTTGVFRREEVSNLLVAMIENRAHPLLQQP